jgi:peptide/nickel transport system ATP-binding protein
LSKTLLTVEDVNVSFPVQGGVVKALDGVSLTVQSGETVAVVGESGSGKTTLARAVLGLQPLSGGTITLLDEPVKGVRRNMAQSVGMVWQDPYASLDPRWTVGRSALEPLALAGQKGDPVALFKEVGLDDRFVDRYPHQLSGGQRQRVAIARALALSPKLIVCDEPVSALDLTTQARILDLFLQIQKDTGVSYLFVSHDLDVVRHISHRVAVMYKGEIVEQGASAQVTIEPTHPYTQRLLMASPVPDPDRQEKRREDRRKLLQTQTAAA